MDDPDADDLESHNDGWYTSIYTGAARFIPLSVFFFFFFLFSRYHYNSIRGLWQMNIRVCDGLSSIFK